VIGTLEDAEDYKAFEAAIIADYDAQCAVERELVLRLASLLWRLRRATTMETGPFEIQADHLREFRLGRQNQPVSRPALTSRVAFCVLPICPITHSAASAATKQLFGAKSARCCLRSTAWIAANHRIGGAITVRRTRPRAAGD
jgi:hypothetical protein